MAEVSGRCFCGAIRWRANGSVLWAGHCHCESCRRASSAPFTSYIAFNRDAVTFDGEPETYASSPGAERGFCGDCGAQIFYKSERWPEEIHLFAASLDNPDDFTPEAHFFWNERVAWADLNDGLPRHPAPTDQAAGCA